MSGHFGNDSLQEKAVRVSSVTEIHSLDMLTKNYAALFQSSKAYVIWFPVTIRGTDSFKIVQLTFNTNSSN